MNIKIVDLGTSQHLTPDFLKMNPAHTIPTIDDNGFILWESRAIMQYLCNQYAPDSTLYPKDPKKRAVVDRWLNFDMSLYSSHRKTLFDEMIRGVPQTVDKVMAFKNDVKFLDQMIGDNKYLTGDELTIADFAVLATTELLCLGHFSEYQNVIRWSESLKLELPYYEEINHLEKEYTFPLIENLKDYIKKAQNNH